MHKDKAHGKAQIVESYLAPETFRLGNQMVRKGSWVMVVKVHDDQLWSDIKSKKYTGFSMGGRARSEN